MMILIFMLKDIFNFLETITLDALLMKMNVRKYDVSNPSL